MLALLAPRWMALAAVPLSALLLIALFTLVPRTSHAQPGPQPDLTGQITGPDTACPGEAIGGEITLTVFNQGTADASGFNVGVYLSDDDIITTSDTLLNGGRESVGSLGKNSQVNVPLFAGASVPGGYKTGAAFLGILVDEFNVVIELNEGNNYEADPIRIVDTGCPTPTPTPTATPVPTTPIRTTAPPITQTPTLTPTLTPTPTVSPAPTGGVVQRLGPYMVLGGAFRSQPDFFPVDLITITPDLRVTNIEVTQATQCLNQTTGDTDCEDNEIPLVARRSTWARVYVTSGNVLNVSNVTVRLQVFLNGAPFLDTSTTTTARALINRDELSHSANFLVLCTGCDDGDVFGFKATVDPNNTIAETNNGNNAFPAVGNLDLTMHERDAFHILARPMRYNPTGPTDATVPNSDLTGQARFIVMAYPVPHFGDYVEYEIGSVYNWTSSFSSTSVKSNVNTAYSGSVSPPDQVSIFVPGETGYSNGTSDPIWGGGQGIATVIDVSYAGPNARARVLSHEIAHNQGRRHPCTSNAQDDPSWPYDGTGVAGLDYDIQETGLRTQVDVVWVFIFPIPIFTPFTRPASQIDMMQGGHCGFPGASAEPNSNDLRWVTPYTYQQLFCSMSPSNTTASSCRNGNAVAIGSTASLPHGSGPQGAADRVLVSGILDPDGTGTISAIYRQDEGDVSPALEGDYCVELRNGDTLLDSRCWTPDFGNQDNESILPQSFSVTLPFAAGADTIALTDNNTVLDTVAISPNAPTVQVTHPSTGGEKSGTVNVSWTADDADGDPLAFALLYTHNGTDFTPVVADITALAAQANLDELPGGDDAFFRVIATDNTGHTTTADSAHFTVANKPPVPEIMFPVNGTAHQVGDPIVLMATASDMEDPPLPADAFEWTSDVDGFMGTGNSGFGVDLAPGLHTITVEVTDSDGLKGTDSVQIFIGIPALVDVRPDVILPGEEPAVTAHLELPNTYSISDVDQSSIVVEVGQDTFTPTNVESGDVDADELPDLLVTLPSSILAAFTGSTPARVMLTGELNDGTPFMGADVVSLSPSGDIDCDGATSVDDVTNYLRWLADLDAVDDCLVYTDGNCDGALNGLDALVQMLDLADVSDPPGACPALFLLDTAPALPSSLAQGRPESRDWQQTWWLSLFVLPALILPFRRHRKGVA